MQVESHARCQVACRGVPSGCPAKPKGMSAAQARLEAQKILNGIRKATSDPAQEFEAPGIDDVAITAAHSFSASVK